MRKITLRYTQDNLGVKKVSPLSKNHWKNVPLLVLPAKKKLPHTFRISGTLIFIIIYTIYVVYVHSLRKRQVKNMLIINFGIVIILHFFSKERKLKFLGFVSSPCSN
jgi:hypothetical protein